MSTDPVIRNGRSYSTARDIDTGLMFVFCDGVKIGQTQSEAGAKLIRRNHARDIERNIAPDLGPVWRS